MSKENECDDCGAFVEHQIECPYAAELLGDYSLVWLCEECSWARAQEI